MDSDEPDKRCTIFPRSADANAPSAPEQSSPNTTVHRERNEGSNGRNRRLRKQRQDENRFDVSVKRNSQEEHQGSKQLKVAFCKNYSP